MGIETAAVTSGIESEEKHRGEKEIQGELDQLNFQIKSIPEEERRVYAHENTQEFMLAAAQAHGEEMSDHTSFLAPEKAVGYEQYKALQHREGELEKERNNFYQSDPAALRTRLKTLTEKVIFENLNEHPEYRNQAVEEGHFRHYMREADESSPYKRELRDLSHIFDKNGREESDRSWLLEAQAEVLEQLKRTEQKAPAPTSFQERVSPNTAEFVTNHILVKDLSYQDAELPDEHKKGILQEQQGSEKARKYAESLANASGVVGLESVRQLAQGIRDSMLSEANRLGIPISPYGKSLSWAMWDTAKQYHFFTHQDENDSRYEIGNPLESEEKREEIINRQLGWEAYAAFRNNPEYKNRVIGDNMSTPALEYFNKPPKENGTLSSKDLAELGKMLRVK